LEITQKGSFKTGVFSGKENDSKDPAKFVVNNMQEAFDLICERERVVAML